MLIDLCGFDFVKSGVAPNPLANLVADGWFDQISAYGQVTGRFDKGKAINYDWTSFYPANVYAEQHWMVGKRFTSETAVVGHAIYCPKVTDTQQQPFGLGVLDGQGLAATGNDLSNVHMVARFEDNGVIRLYRRTGANSLTLVATTPSKSWHDDQWNYIEFKVKISATSGIFEVRVNTVTKLSYVGNTKSYETELLAATPGWDGVFYDHGGYYPFNDKGARIDDRYVLDDTGSNNTDYLGNVRVNTQFTVAPGDLTQFSRFGPATSNWDAVNDPDLTDTQYVYDGVAGDKDLYTMDPNVAALNIFGVQVRGAYRQDDSTQMVARNIIKTGGTIYEGTVDHYLSANYTYYKDIWELNPNTGVGWIAADLNAIQAGTKVQSVG